MKRNLKVGLLCAMVVFSLTSVEAAVWPFGKKAKKQEVVDTTAVESKAKKSKSKYEKLFGDKTKCCTAEGEFMTLHTVGDKIYAEVGNDLFGRDVLIASTISEISNGSLGSVGYKPQKPLHCRFVKIDTAVYLTRVNIIPDHKEEVSEAIRRVNIDPIMMKFKTACQTPDSTATVFEITPLLKSSVKELMPITDKGNVLMSLSVKWDDALFHLGDVKSFEDNVTIRSYLSGKATLQDFLGGKSSTAVTALVTRTILLLPEEPARARVADSRVGIFLSNRTTFDAPTEQSDTYSVIHRWRVEPADDEAYARGELVEPKKPIIFYLDDAFPAELRPAAKEGIERWNMAFEKIGFKNVVRVFDYPKDDPNFDPDNLKYSCVRWLPSTTANAMGPSWVDPRSGEIINASVIVYSDVVSTIHSWRFVQTAQVDERVRSLRLHPDVRDDSWSYVLAHEVGHCLGFMHNMSASAAVPVESLRDAEYTQKNGTTVSIMDYARFNYVAQPQDKGVALGPPALGAYDYWLVEYAYKPVPEAEDMWAEAKVLEQWVSAKAGDKTYRYGRQQTSARLDPSAIEEDLSDDPVQASQYGVQNLQYIVENMGEWIGDDVDSYGKYREALYNALVKQYNRYMNAVLLNVGGVYLTSTHASEASQRAVPVAAAYQKKALRWAMKQVDNCEWIENKTLTEKFRLRVSRAEVVAFNHARAIFATYAPIALCSYLAPEGEAFTLEEWLNECRNWVWAPTNAGRNLTKHDRMKQKHWVNTLLLVGCTSPSLSSASLTALSEEAYAPSVDHILAFNLDESGLMERYAEPLRELEEQEGRGAVAAMLFADETSFGPAGYGTQGSVSMKVVDEAQMHFYGEVLSTKAKLEKLIARSSGTNKIHYQNLLEMINKKLEGRK